MRCVGWGGGYGELTRRLFGKRAPRSVLGIGTFLIQLMHCSFLAYGDCFAFMGSSASTRCFRDLECLSRVFLNGTLCCTGGFLTGGTIQDP